MRFSRVWKAEGMLQLAVLALLSLSAPARAVSLANSSWPVNGRDHRGTARVGPATAEARVRHPPWELATGGAVDGTPAVASDGTVLAPSADGYLCVCMIRYCCICYLFAFGWLVLAWPGTADFVVSDVRLFVACWSGFLMLSRQMGFLERSPRRLFFFFAFLVDCWDVCIFVCMCGWLRGVFFLSDKCHILAHHIYFDPQVRAVAVRRCQVAILRGRTGRLVAVHCGGRR
jgi:hypothetical protein